MSVFFCGDCYALSGKVFSRFMVVNCVLRKIFHRQYELFAKSHPASVIASVLGIKWRTRQTLWGAMQMLTQKLVAKRYMIAKK